MTSTTSTLKKKRSAVTEVGTFFKFSSGGAAELVPGLAPGLHLCEHFELIFSHK